MARGNRQEELKKVTYKAKALVYIKYDKASYKPGDEFEVKEKDVKELVENGYADVEKVEVSKDNADEEDNGAGKEGE